MKKIIVPLFLLLIVLLPIEVKALSVEKNELTIGEGASENIELFANVDTNIKEIQFTLVYTTYDVPGYFNVAQGLTDNNPGGPVHKITLSEEATGSIKLGTIKVNAVNNPKDRTGNINVHSATATTTEGETINLKAQIINVIIGETETKPQEVPKTEVEKNLLDKIESKIVDIKLEKDVYEYKINIKEDIKELDLKAIPKNDKYKVEISNQKISELKDDTITITVSDGDNKEEYKIKVNIIEEVEIEIDEEEFEPTYKYKSKWIILIVVMSIILAVGLVLTKKK